MRSKIAFAMALTPFLLNAAMPQKTVSEKKDEPCRSPFHVMHVDVRHTESKGVGYNNGYTTLEGFGIYDHNPCFMPFLDLRGHVFNNGQLAGNVGLGERTVIPSINQVFGFYLYYDVRQEEHDLTVNQLSPGVELLGKRMEYRINAYFPVGKDESHSYQHKFAKFDGNRMILKHKKKYAMTGVDGEVGAHITQSTRHDFYFGIGPYYFTADPNNAWGGKSRLYWRYRDYISLEASYSYDHIFKNVVQGSVALSYPFGKKLQRKGRGCPNMHDLALSRAAFAPYRFEIPVVETHSHRKAAISPVTNRPFTVWFVDNTSHSAGTYESPFPTLVQAQNASGPNDIIYVFPGDGTTTGMNAGITLQDGQFLFGSATPQTVKTTVGKIKIRPFSLNMPMITNPPLSPQVITLGNGNEISGMNIAVQGIAANIGISNNNPIVGVNIHDNVFSGSTGAEGVRLNLGSGIIKIKHNQFVNPNLGASNQSAIAILAQNGMFTEANLSNNNILGYEDGIFFGVSGLLTVPSTATGSVTIAGNRIANFGDEGIALGKGIPNGPYRIVNNTIIDTMSAGLPHGGIIINQLTTQPNMGTYLISGNTITSTTPNGGDTGCMIIRNAPGTTTTGRFTIENNTLRVSPTAGSYGITMNADGSSVFCVSATNNTVTTTGAGTNGISISGATGVVNIDNFANNISPNVLLSGNVNEVAPGTCGQ